MEIVCRVMMISFKAKMMSIGLLIQHPTFQQQQAAVSLQDESSDKDTESDQSGPTSRHGGGTSVTG